MYVSRHKISDLYESRLIREMDEKIIDYLNDHVEDLPFAHIFGDDLRIYVPIYKDPTAKEIIDTLKRIKDYGGLDVERGEVVRKIKLDPKYGGGEKEQRVNIGSAISKLKISEEDKKKYLDWLARYKNNMVESLGEQKYGIVISRAPIDVLRMSDFAGMSSCHTQPGKFGQKGQYFQCAVQEAINGGGVAFIVDNEEFNTTLENGYSLNDEEFFSDNDRGGDDDFSPISRLRIRRLVDDKGNEFAIPDIKIYGNQSIPGFYDTLKKFLNNKQPLTFEEFKQYKWEKRGGTYYDSGNNEIAGLVRSYFDEKDYIEIKHNRSDESDENNRESEVKQLARDLEAECREITESYNRRMTYTNVGCYVEFDDGGYIMPYGEVEIDTSTWGVDLSEVNFALERDRYDMRKALQGDYDDDIIWSGLLNWIEDQSGLELDSFEFTNRTIKFTYYSEEIFYSPDEYDRFCGKVEDYDIQMKREFQKPNDWLETFGEVGIIKNEENENSVYRLIQNSSDDLEVENEWDDRYAQWEIMVDALTQERWQSQDPDSIYDNHTITETGKIGDTLATMLDNYIKTYYKIKPQLAYQPNLKNFVESYYQARMMGNSSIKQYDIDKVFVSLDTNTYHGNAGASKTIIFNIKLKVESFNDENVNLILFLDNNLNDLKNMATFAYLSQNRYVITGSPRYKDQFNALQRVYGKLL